ncbi:LysM peptidoglycan-binding domain-containing protein [Nocardioides sp. LHG3406-4]|uniref:LysM peptidoglycan-binding domain-containing protein n=1 Tax=Nocardioides sp. LHG3406-4 TaxID=2804575 RepID=UPI003CEA088C
MGFLDSLKGARKKDVAPAPTVAEPEPTTSEPTTSEPGAEPAVNESAGPTSRIHTVKPGEALGDIAERYGVDSLDIARLNAIEDPHLIFPGQVFKIPTG